MNKNKILIIEDDVWISISLKMYLENSWFEVFCEDSWKNATQKIIQENFDLVVLDINLPEKNWIIICNEVRTQKNFTPIIMLTARNNEVDKVNCLDIWADDYISKPFSPRELLARINTILRRTKNSLQNTKKDILTYKNIEIDLNKNTVFADKIEIFFTKNEFDILKKIIQENWNIVPRETLMTEVIWYENYAFDRTIDTHIKNIRKKLQNKEIILTIRWIWYRLNN